MKDLKVELQTIKEDNEIILRAWEELNQILLDKIHNGAKYKRKEYETNSRRVSYKLKGKQLKISDSESSESDIVPRKRKYKP